VKKAKEMVTITIPAREARFPGGQVLQLPTVNYSLPAGELAQVVHALKVLHIERPGIGLYLPENPVHLLLHDTNGPIEPGDPPGVRKLPGAGLDAEAKRPAVSAGLTDTETAIGFIVYKPDGNDLGFVLNRSQVEALRDYLTAQLPRVKG
jgi:hypothetical protein